MLAGQIKIILTPRFMNGRFKSGDWRLIDAACLAFSQSARVQHIGPRIILRCTHLCAAPRGTMKSIYTNSRPFLSLSSIAIFPPPPLAPLSCFPLGICWYGEPWLGFWLINNPPRTAPLSFLPPPPLPLLYWVRLCMWGRWMCTLARPPRRTQFPFSFSNNIIASKSKSSAFGYNCVVDFSPPRARAGCDQSKVNFRRWPLTKDQLMKFHSYSVD